MRARLSVPGQAGPIPFSCFDNWLSRWTCEEILAGRTYPLLPAIGEVRTVVDVGANCGAASVFFAVAYPDAVVHALEPAGEVYAVLEENASGHRNIEAHRLGLSDTDQRVPLYHGEVDGVTASTTPNAGSTSEEIELRAAGAWLREQGIDSIDILKIDVEGGELPILEDLGDWLPTVRVLYLEYGGRETRQRLERLLAASHSMALGRIMLSHGEVVYVRSDLAGAELERAIGELLRDQVRAAATQPGPGPDPASSPGPASHGPAGRA